MMDLALQLENVESGYGEVQVLWGISLEVARGKLTTIIGTNGAGKTTSLRTIMGSLRAWKGRVLLHGEDVTRLPPHAKANRGLVLVPEGRQLFPDMSVEENLEMGGYSKRARKRAETEPGTRLYTVPAPERTPPAEVLHPLRRRAADAGHGPRLDAGAGGADDRRTLARSGPGAGATTLPDLGQPCGNKGSPSSWWNRMCTSHWRSATTPTCLPKVESASAGSRRKSQRMDEVRRAYLGL